MTMKRTVLCVLTPCSPENTQCFEGTYRLHLQGRKVSQARNQQEVRVLTVEPRPSIEISVHRIMKNIVKR
jgi:hypothetical protein